jgi:hypothetical protein
MSLIQDKNSIYYDTSFDYSVIIVPGSIGETTCKVVDINNIYDDGSWDSDSEYSVYIEDLETTGEYINEDLIIDDINFEKVNVNSNVSAPLNVSEINDNELHFEKVAIVKSSENEMVELPLTSNQTLPSRSEINQLIVLGIIK